MKHARSIAGIWGYLLTGECEALDEYARLACERNNGKPVIVNIGAGAGTSGLVFREACLDAELYTVDFCESGPLGSLEGERNAFRDTGLAHPTQILGKSADIGKSWNPDKKIDLLFIDDGHHRPDVIADIEAWWPHVKIGGIVIFHDYNAAPWPDVEEVVDEFMIGQKYLGLYNTVFVVEKEREL